ncbi:MAG TPA: NADH-quinone oxidoreductase subunit N [Blastocatellia bacterium]|jgi:NADH-quinone oxidoreductase subunit N
MTIDDLIALSPLIAVASAAVALMLLIAFYRDARAALICSLIGIAVAFATLPVAAARSPRQITPLLILDRYALFYLGLLFTASFAVALIAEGYLDRLGGEPEEFYLVSLLATVGAATLVMSAHFASFFLGLEILSVSLYVLIAYPNRSAGSSARGVEAGIKYLILAAASAAFTLFGMALIYAELGTMEFGRMASSMAGGGARRELLLAGQAMIFVGVGFKLAVAPFHVWAPDVYEGAPAPVTAFIATVSKGAVFALLVRYFANLGDEVFQTFFPALAAIAVASMFVGNLLALAQNNVKRILAYSSIAHFGYLLVAFLAGGSLGATAVAFYLVAYFVTNLIAFGVVAVLSGRREADELEDYRGLFWRRPWLATIFLTALLSLGGIPLTAGFMGKFYVLMAGVRSALWLLAIIMTVNTMISFYYYLRVAFMMFRDAPEREAATGGPPSLSFIGAAALAVLTLSLVWIGVYPGPLVQTIRSMVADLR